MTSGILLVTGGDTFARHVFATEGRADWAQAVPLVLEKLGYLDFDTAEPEALEDHRTWHRPGILLVARVPPEAWTKRAVELAERGTVRALVECPPATLHRSLGITEAVSAERVGTVAPRSDDLRAAVTEFATRGSTHLAPPRSREIPRDASLDWNRLDVPITTQQAESWRAPDWEAEHWHVGEDTEVLAQWDPADGSNERWPAIVARDRLIGTCFSLLGYLGQQTTVQPFQGSEHLNWSRCTALEVMLAALLDRMHREARTPRVRVMPWPSGGTWVLSTRHDYDRELPTAEIDQILAQHRRAGSAATWYWRSRYLGSAERDRIARHVDRAPGQEVAHHTELLWTSSAAEQGVIEHAIRRPVSGSCAHGDPHCFRWQGAPNLLWAQGAGLSYTEFISHVHLHPHRFSALRSDGTLQHSRVICLPHHLSLDRSTTPGDAAGAEILAASEEYVRGGGMLQILSHPDVNIGPLFDLIDRLPRAGRLDLTAEDASDWWRRSHVRDELRIARRRDGAVTITSRSGVRGLVVEILLPDGTTARHIVQVDPGASIVILVPGASDSNSKRWRDGVWERQAVPVFDSLIRRYYEAKGTNTESPDVRSTISTNTELVPNRVETICRYLRELQGVDSLMGARILDVGGGFGAFAAYLALDSGSPDITTIDIRPDFVATSQEAAARLDLANLDSQLADMRSLHAFADEQFDVVILNNSFLYLTTKADMRLAISEIARVLRHNGHVVFFHANRWRFREPFTRSPIVHLLPARAARLVCRLTGWRHNHGRVLLVSASWLGRELRRHGLEGVRTEAQGRMRGLPRTWLVGFYAATARKP
ncbi:MAG: class I SAM-dependent methyltransferase [Solirubrobacteraceae bacterium]